MQCTEKNTLWHTLYYVYTASSASIAEFAMEDLGTTKISNSCTFSVHALLSCRDLFRLPMENIARLFQFHMRLCLTFITTKLYITLAHFEIDFCHADESQTHRRYRWIQHWLLGNRANILTGGYINLNFEYFLVRFGTDQKVFEV